MTAKLPTHYIQLPTRLALRSVQRRAMQAHDSTGVPWFEKLNIPNRFYSGYQTKNPYTTW